MAEAVLEIRDLVVRYRVAGGDSTAVDNVSLTINRGEIVGIAGESGSGKTTLATSVLRLLRPPGYIAGGQVIVHPAQGESFDMLRLTGRQLRAVRWRNLSYLPQGSMNSLNPVARIKDQFADVMHAHSRLTRRQIDARVPELLGRVGLDPAVALMYPHELSGGMKQRVITAIAISLEPDLLIADEPTTALDVTVQRLVLQNLAELRDNFGVTVAIITHDMGVHAQLVDKVAVMHEGRIVEFGGVHQVFKTPVHAYTKSLIAANLSVDFGQRAESGIAQEEAR